MLEIENEKLADIIKDSMKSVKGLEKYMNYVVQAGNFPPMQEKPLSETLTGEDYELE
jgi:hypothetical protein